jgi:DNA polymerase I-like protein with 3'-5' exonuclease and polymerase domains
MGGATDRTLVAFDIETDGLDPLTDNIIAIALYCDAWETPFIFQDVRGLSNSGLIFNIFNAPDYALIGHNLAFDLSFIKEKWGIDYPAGGSLWDTMLAEQMLTAGFDEQLVNLADTIERHFGVVLDKSLQTSFTMDSEITEEQIEYIKNDVMWLPKLAMHQAHQLSEIQSNDAWEIERYALPVFTEMNREGIEINLDRMVPLLEQTKGKRDALQRVLQAKLTPLVEWKRLEDYKAEEAELAAWNAAREDRNTLSRNVWSDFWGMEGDELSTFEDREEWEANKWTDRKINKKDNYPEGMRRFVRHHEKLWRQEHPRPAKPKQDTDLINLNSRDQMMVAFESLGLPLPNFRSQTLSQKLLDANEEQTEVLKRLIEYKKCEKLLQAFGDPLLEKISPDSRIRGNFKQIGTATGRPSCSEPNMLQMPKSQDFRACFVASEGNVLIVADYSQMELRIMAQLSHDPAMMKAFNSGIDLHSYTAHLMFNIPLDTVDKDGKERKIAKVINFGTLYGMGPNKLRETLLAEGVVMTFPEAKSAIARWKSTYKRAAEMIERLGLEAITLGYTSTPLGRKRFFNTTFKEQSEKFAVMREGANHPIQGTNADVTKLAMHLIQEKVKPLGGRVALQMYDEIVTQVPEGIAEWGESVVQSCMKAAAQMVLTDVPAAVDSMISRSWSKLDAIK